MTPLSIYFENAIVPINAKIPKIRIASKNAFVFNTIETMAIAEIRFTPIVSSAIARSGSDGHIITR